MLTSTNKWMNNYLSILSSALPFVTNFAVFAVSHKAMHFVKTYIANLFNITPCNRKDQTTST